MRCQNCRMQQAVKLTRIRPGSGGSRWQCQSCIDRKSLGFIRAGRRPPKPKAPPL